jgi:hypothetical protein
MKNIYVIAWTWRDTDMTIEYFYTPEKTVKRLSELISDDLGEKADPSDDPLDYLGRYADWINNENDNMCDVVIAIEVIKLN